MRQSFIELEDEALVSMIQQGDSEAMDYLLRKYTPLVNKETRTVYIIGADDEDLIQEGMIGLFKAIRDYRENRGAGFYTFAKTCIKGQICSAVTASNRKKHTPLNTYVSFYAQKGNKESMDLMDILEADLESNPEERMIRKESIAWIESKIQDKLSVKEQQVLSDYLEGRTYQEIAQHRGITKKSVDNAIQRIRAKLSAEIEKSEK